MHILLTNDDGCRSPLLPVIIRHLAEFAAELTVVVPKHEQSWKSKALSGFDPVAYEVQRIEGQQLHIVDGTPADCTNIGLYYLCPSKPDLLVSGVNIGANLGACFVFSSGTVGACLEANVAGVPALALSQKMSDEEFSRYRKSGFLEECVLEQLRSRVTVFTPKTLKLFGDNPHLLDGSVTWNINFPYQPNAAVRHRLCSLGRIRYGSCFTRIESGFRHRLVDVTPDPDPAVDAQMLEKGYITLTPLRLFSWGQVDDRARQAVGDLMEK